MQSTNNVKEIPKSSVTALSVALAFLRALETGHLYLFSDMELALVKHFYFKGKQSFPFYDNKLNKVLVETISASPYSLQQWLLQKMVITGYDHLILLRKLMVKNKIDEAVNNGLKQLVFIGGGYDIRSLLASMDYPDLQVFELDRGQTRDGKINGLRTIPAESIPKTISIKEMELGGVQVNSNLRYISCDLSEDDLIETLNRYGFDSDLQTLVVCEGLTMYLDQNENEKLLVSLANLINDKSQLLLSYIAKVEYTAVVSASLNSSKELYRFSITKDDVILFLARNGFSPTGRFVAADNLDRIGEHEKAEYFKKAEYKLEEYYLLEKKSGVNLVNSVEEIPAIEFHIPPRPESTSSCTIS